MRKITILLSLLLLQCVYVHAQTLKLSHQKSINASKIIFHNITFPTKMIGFAGGSNGCFAKTTNAGETWFQLKVPDTLFAGYFSFPNENVGILLKSSRDSLTFKRYLHVFSTINGGITWQSKNTYLPLVNSLLGNVLVKMFSENFGFIFLDKSKLYKTSDGWKNYTEIDISSFLAHRSKVGVPFADFTPINFDTIFVNNYSKVFRTTNGGNNWDVVYEIKQENENISKIVWNESGKIYLMYLDKIPNTSIDTLLTLQSEDFGDNWTSLNIEKNLNTSILVKDSRILFTHFQNDRNFPILSIDEGETWYEFESSNDFFGWNGRFQAGTFADSSTIFLCASSGNFSGIIKVDFSNLVTSTQEKNLSKSITLRETGDVGVLSAQNQIVDIICYDVLGNVVQGSVNIQGNNVTILKSQLPNGVYYLQVRTITGTEVVPFVNVR